MDSESRDIIAFLVPCILCATDFGGCSYFYSPRFDHGTVRSSVWKEMQLHFFSCQLHVAFISRMKAEREELKCNLSKEHCSFKVITLHTSQCSIN